MPQSTWNRNYLYERVWNQPVTKIAKEFGISDVTIAKVWRKLSIPLPGRGYWAQKPLGYEVSRKPLPELKKAIVVARDPPTLTPKPTSAPALHPADQAEFERIDKLAAEAAFAFAPTNNIHRHPLIVATTDYISPSFLQDVATRGHPDQSAVDGGGHPPADIRIALCELPCSDL